MRRNKNGSLQEVAERVLTRRVRARYLNEPEMLSAELQAQICASKANEPTVTVAQAIVLAIGRKALDGDKTAAEFLQRLADRAGEEDAADEEPDMVIRVRMVDGGAEAGEQDEKTGKAEKSTAQRDDRGGQTAHQ